MSESVKNRARKEIRRALLSAGETFVFPPLIENHLRNKKCESERARERYLYTPRVRRKPYTYSMYMRGRERDKNRRKAFVYVTTETRLCKTRRLECVYIEASARARILLATGILECSICARSRGDTTRDARQRKLHFCWYILFSRGGGKV